MKRIANGSPIFCWGCLAIFNHSHYFFKAFWNGFCFNKNKTERQQCIFHSLFPPFFSVFSIKHPLMPWLASLPLSLLSSAKHIFFLKLQCQLTLKLHICCDQAPTATNPGKSRHILAIFFCLRPVHGVPTNPNKCRQIPTNDDKSRQFPTNIFPPFKIELVFPWWYMSNIMSLLFILLVFQTSKLNPNIVFMLAICLH